MASWQRPQSGLLTARLDRQSAAEPTSVNARSGRCTRSCRSAAFTTTALTAAAVPVRGSGGGEGGEGGGGEGEGEGEGGEGGAEAAALELSAVAGEALPPLELTALREVVEPMDAETAAAAREAAAEAAAAAAAEYEAAAKKGKGKKGEEPAPPPAFDPDAFDANVRRVAVGREEGGRRVELRLCVPPPTEAAADGATAAADGDGDGADETTATPVQTEWVLGSVATQGGKGVLRGLLVPTDVPAGDATLVLAEVTDDVQPVALPRLGPIELPLVISAPPEETV